MTTTGAPPPRMIWARVAVDPLAEPLSRWLAIRPSVTPNRVTALAACLSLGAAACFASGQVRWGGALFLFRYFFDCVDGMVARHQGSGSQAGAAFDLTSDVVGIHLVAAALGWHLVETGKMSPAVAVGLLAAIGVYNWSLSQRKMLATAAGRGDGGVDHQWHTDLPILRQWVAYAARIRMAAFPWVLEVEIVLLGLGPLLAPGLLPWIVPAGTAAYVGFGIVNVARTQRLAQGLDCHG